MKKKQNKKIVYGSWKIINKKKKKYYKDEYNQIYLSSKQIHSDALWENVGLAIKIALDLGVSKKIIERTVPTIKFEGRVQFVKGNLTKKLPKTKMLVDGCHSDESTKNLARFLKKFNLPIYGIWGSLKNKSPSRLIKNFKNIFKKVITIKIPDEPNSMSSIDLYKIAMKNNFKVAQAKNIRQALKKISSKEKKIIVIFGSLYLVGHALSIN